MIGDVLEDDDLAHKIWMINSRQGVFDLYKTDISTFYSLIRHHNTDAIRWISDMLNESGTINENTSIIYHRVHTDWLT